jgi:hypothetical protein
MLNFALQVDSRKFAPFSHTIDLFQRNSTNFHQKENHMDFAYWKQSINIFLIIICVEFLES